MIRATTPEYTFIFEHAVDDYDRILLTFEQERTDGEVIQLNYEKGDLQIVDNEATIKFTETDTKQFEAGAPIRVQLRAAMNGRSYATTIGSISVKDVLNDMNLVGEL